MYCMNLEQVERMVIQLNCLQSELRPALYRTQKQQARAKHPEVMKNCISRENDLLEKLEVFRLQDHL